MVDVSGSFWFEQMVKELMERLSMPENEITEKFLKAYEELEEGALIKEFIPMLVKNHLKHENRHQLKSIYRKDKGEFKIELEGYKACIKIKEKNNERKVLKLFNKLIKLFQTKTEEKK